MGAIMTSRQAAELDYALERNKWTSEDVKRLSVGDTLGRILPIIRGMAMNEAAGNSLNFITTTTVSSVTNSGDTVSKFFSTREGLCVSDDFDTPIGRELLSSPIKRIPPTRLSCYDLARQVGDLRIQVEFSKIGTPFMFENFSDFLSILASLIVAQWGGKKDGPLLTNDHTNSFYVCVGGFEYVFSVFFSYARWNINVSLRGRREWSAGSRVFASR